MRALQHGQNVGVGGKGGRSGGREGVLGGSSPLSSSESSALLPIDSCAATVSATMPTSICPGRLLEEESTEPKQVYGVC